MQVHHNTFSTQSTESKTFRNFTFNYDVGNVDVTFQGKTFTAKAKRSDDGDIFVFGFVGKYRTGNKLWKAFVMSKIVDGKEQVVVDFGRDDRMNFQKANIFYKPE